MERKRDVSWPLLCALCIIAGIVVSAIWVISQEANAGRLGGDIVNTTGKYLVWEDYKIEVNQYGGLGRDWPTPDLFWEQYEMLREKAKANPVDPNTIKAVLSEDQ